eukprot:2850697-Rhodomonas_salina.1
MLDGGLPDRCIAPPAPAPAPAPAAPPLPGLLALAAARGSLSSWRRGSPEPDKESSELTSAAVSSSLYVLYVYVIVPACVGCSSYSELCSD